MLPFDPLTHLHITTTIFLAWCAVLDVQHRQLPNLVWIAGAALLLPFRFMLPLDAWSTLAWGLGLSFTAILAWGLHLWGGADAKGIILLAWSLPIVADVHALLYAIPMSLVGVLAWQHIKPGPVPYYALLAPSLALIFTVQVLIR